MLALSAFFALAQQTSRPSPAAATPTWPTLLAKHAQRRRRRCSRQAKGRAGRRRGAAAARPHARCCLEHTLTPSLCAPLQSKLGAAEAGKADEAKQQQQDEAGGSQQQRLPTRVRGALRGLSADEVLDEPPPTAALYLRCVSLFLLRCVCVARGGGCFLPLFPNLNPSTQQKQKQKKGTTRRSRRTRCGRTASGTCSRCASRR